MNKSDYPLPPRDEWQGIKDWCYRVYYKDGDEVLEVEL